MTEIAAPAVDQVDRTMADLPSIQVAVEQEYKWRVDAEGFLGTASPSPQALEQALPLPRGAVPLSRFRHTQSSIYFDDHWQLAEHQLTLKAIVNPGAFRNLAWLVAKHTIAWTDGCRDSLEVSARVTPRDIPRAVRERSTLPMRYLERQCRRPVSLTAYAAASQIRHKLHLRTSSGAVLQASFDVATTRLLPAGQTSTETWLEIESTSSELRPRGELDDWARRITDHLGTPPHRLSKPEVAARLAGWLPAED